MNEEKKLHQKGVWRGKNGDIEIAKMSNEHLEKAFLYSGQQANFWHVRAMIHNDKEEELETEMRKRGLDPDVLLERIQQEKAKA